jgi:hypothetical protein
MAPCQGFRIIGLGNLGKDIQGEKSVATTVSLNFMVPAKGPFCRMINNAGPNHVQVNINETATQMLA